MPDDSCLQPIWAEIRRLTEVQQGGATLAQELRESVLKIGKLGSLSTGDQVLEMVDQVKWMTRLKSMLGINVIGPDDEYTNRSNPPTGFHELSDAGWQAIAAVTGIAQIVLMGEAPGGLSTDGSSGWEGFRQLISDYQEDKLREPLEQLYTVVYAAQDGPTSGVAPDAWALEFAPLDEPDEAKIAATRKLVAETDAIYIASGVLAPDHVAMSRFGPDGWSLDIDVVDEPQPDELAATALLMLGTRADADEAVWIRIPAADPGLRPQVERAIGQPLAPAGSPHVTVLYLGSGLLPDEIAEVVAIVADESSRAEPDIIECGIIRTFPEGSDGIPVIVEFENASDLAQLHDRLLTRLAHLVRYRQHPRYRPHVTLGYALQPLTPEAGGALLEIDAAAVRVPVTVLQVMIGGTVAAESEVSG